MRNREQMDRSTCLSLALLIGTLLFIFALPAPEDDPPHSDLIGCTCPEW